MGTLVVLIIQGLIVDACHNKLFGKRTILSYIPLCSDYIFGKCAAGKSCGILIVILAILSANDTEVLENGKTAVTYYFGSLGQMCSVVYGFIALACFILFIYRFVTGKKPHSSEISPAPPLPNHNLNQVPVVDANTGTSVSLTPNIPVVDVSKNCDCGYTFNDTDVFCPQCGKKKEQ